MQPEDLVIQDQESQVSIVAIKNRRTAGDDSYRELLAGTGLTVRQAIEIGLKHRHEPADMPVGRILEQFLVNRQAVRNIRRRTFDEYRCQLGKFVDDFGERTARELSAIDIEKWLIAPHFDTKGRKRIWGASRRNATRGYISTLFAFGLRKGFCSINPAYAVDKAIVERVAGEIWTPAEVRLILEAAMQECSEVVPFLALALFSGVRTCELFELSTEHVKLAQGVVAVPPPISKTRKLRNVPVAKNLAAWLGETLSGAGRIWSMGETSLHRRYRLIERVTGLKWRRNALRHSYASSHLALHDNEYLTSRACGHSPRTLRDYYDAVVSKATGQEYFAIFPHTMLLAEELPRA